MNFAKNWLNSCLLFAFYFLLTSCIVTPRIVQDRRPSFDGNEQNSGVIGFDDAGNTILTPHARERYNGLVERYGAKFSPPLKTDAGVTATSTNAFLLDAQHTVDFAVMNRWRKSGL